MASVPMFSAWQKHAVLTTPFLKQSRSTGLQYPRAISQVE